MAQQKRDFFDRYMIFFLLLLGLVLLIKLNPKQALYTWDFLKIEWKHNTLYVSLYVVFMVIAVSVVNKKLRQWLGMKTAGTKHKVREGQKGDAI